MTKLRDFLVCVALPLTCACTPLLSKASDAMGPDHTQREKMECTGGQSKFLVVDWPSVERAEIEARASRGLVVVRYGECRLDVLRRCQVTGDARYDYVGLTPKKDKLKIRDASELYANIPMGAAKLDAKLAHGGALDVDMTIVGQYETSRPMPSQGELHGECEGATHVVTAITFGSFEFSAMNSTEAGAGVNVLGAGAGAKGVQAKEVLNQDGDDVQCQSASGSDTKPPFGCGALLRLEVVPLGVARQEAPVCAPGTAWNGAQCVAVRTEIHCEAGMIADKEKGCVPKRADIAPSRMAAAPDKALVAPVGADCADEATCKTRCDANDAKACAGLGGLLRAGLAPGKPSDAGERAKVAFTKACDNGQSRACTALGEMMFQGLGVARDETGAIERLEQGCRGGDPAGCNDVGHAILSKDAGMAKEYYERACNETSALGCFTLGTLYRDGRGVAKDAGRAKQLFTRACDEAKVAPACKQLGR
jgi:uncharacterized protein